MLTFFKKTILLIICLLNKNEFLRLTIFCVLENQYKLTYCVLVMNWSHEYTDAREQLIIALKIFPKWIEQECGKLRSRYFVCIQIAHDF